MSSPWSSSHIHHAMDEESLVRSQHGSDKRQCVDMGDVQILPTSEEVYQDFHEHSTVNYWHLFESETFPYPYQTNFGLPLNSELSFEWGQHPEQYHIPASQNLNNPNHIFETHNAITCDPFVPSNVALAKNDPTETPIPLAHSPCTSTPLNWLTNSNNDTSYQTPVSDYSEPCLSISIFILLFLLTSFNADTPENNLPAEDYACLKSSFTDYDVCFGMVSIWQPNPKTCLILIRISRSLQGQLRQMSQLRKKFLIRVSMSL